MKWDSTLGELLGPARAKKFAGVTLTNVMSHRAGLPPDPGGRTTGAPGESITVVRRRVVDAALSGEPLYPAGAGYQYSNLDYILLGSILEQLDEKTGRAWEDIVRDEIFTPLKLTSAGFGPPGTVGAITQPRGHQANGATLVPVEPGPFADNPPIYGPAGTIHLSIADLARWGQEHLRGERGEDGILKTATFKILHTPPVTPGDYALGWVSQTKNGQRVIWHNGSNTLWYAIVAFNAATDKGVVLVTNGSINARLGLDALAFQYLTER